MIDKNKFMWGLNPLPEDECLAVWGARAIFLRGELDFLPDRQQALGSETARRLLGKWIARTALPRLKKHIRENRWVLPSLRRQSESAPAESPQGSGTGCR